MRKLKIHVFDENRKISREFECYLHHLKKYMLYFEPYLREGRNTEDIDISVHCDVKIFDWLLRYVEYREWVIDKERKHRESLG